MMTIDSADQPFGFEPLADGSNIVVKHEGTQTTFMSAANGASPTDAANEVCLLFSQPTASFEIEFALGAPKEGGGVDLQGCGGAGDGHNILSSGETRYPPCPHEEETSCFAAGWRDAGDKSGLHSCPASAGEARLQGDKHKITGEGSSSECCSSPAMDCSNDLLMDIHASKVLTLTLTPTLTLTLTFILTLALALALALTLTLTRCCTTTSAASAPMAATRSCATAASPSSTARIST